MIINLRISFLLTLLTLSTILAQSVWAESSALSIENVSIENDRLLKEISDVHALSNSELAALRSIFARSTYISQGNPAISHHPVTTAQCREKLEKQNLTLENNSFEKICGAKYMAPLFDPKTEGENDAKACIDQFEFPNIPCEYPVVWVRAREAQEICSALGKRMCDAHEWEGGCAGILSSPDYRFDLAKGKASSAAISAMRTAHNHSHSPTKSWAYGPEYRIGICAASSQKSAKCMGGEWNTCGSNTFPSGYFPDCKSSLEVYDLHGNAAEHMNLPLDETQMTSKGSTTLGHTEMKGSWFIFDRYRAHEDWCRWRAPYWHGSRVMDSHSHHNYHLGFRCCQSLH